jgi:hypothetical protein
MPPGKRRRRAPGCSARWTSNGTHARARTSATSWTAGSKSSMSSRRLAADTCSWSKSTSGPCWAVSRSPASTRNCWRRSTRDCASTATTATAGGSSSTARPGRMNATQDATACLPRTVSLQRSPGPLDPQRRVRQSGPLEVDRPQPRASGGQAGTPPSGSAAAERRRRFPNRHGSVARPGLGDLRLVRHDARRSPRRTVRAAMEERRPGEQRGYPATRDRGRPGPPAGRAEHKDAPAAARRLGR